MVVKIGSVKLSGTGCPLSRNRAKAKRTLRSIAKMCGVEEVYFVRAKHVDYGGLYNHRDSTIVIVEQEKSRKIPMYVVVFRFFHELTHHLQREGGIFKAYYFDSADKESSRNNQKKYTPTDRQRAALRAERHANRKACELAYEFFSLEIKPPEYPREFLRQRRGDIFG